ncbi:MAG: T9SS type A sorting domain-containing protein [Anaerolineae bacterium]|nr:T9SS type A sorting domain-containing protein [Anaerolineae bacterium]
MKEFDVTFRNQFTGVSGNPGIIKVNNSTKNSPHIEKVREFISVTVQANWHVYNGIEYTFKNWQEDGSTSAQRTFVPTNNKTYTATYTGKPRAMIYYNLQVNTTPGQNIKLAWNVHPNTNVTQYQVWRKVRPMGGSEGPPQLKATLGRSTTSWIDNEYVITDGYTDDLVWYDVRAYYSKEATYADPNYINAFGETNTMVRTAADALDILPLPEGYAISVFPNPFNPATTLRFQIEEESAVSLIIYDIQGRRVNTLVEDRKSAGVYNIAWSGVNSQNQRVASGVYFYRFSATPANGKEQFLRSGKLLLAK